MMTYNMYRQYNTIRLCTVQIGCIVQNRVVIQLEFYDSWDKGPSKMALSLTICVPPSKLIYACLFRAWQYRPKIISLYFLRWMEMQDVQLQSKLFNPPLHIRFIGKIYNFSAVCNKQITQELFKQFNETNITRVLSKFNTKLYFNDFTAVSKLVNPFMTSIFSTQLSTL